MRKPVLPTSNAKNKVLDLAVHSQCDQGGGLRRCSAKVTRIASEQITGDLAKDGSYQER
uniref:Uncharacterized protein n=1 Tax=Arundo donax TaxID=35708 RepID=A0A0A9E9F9_ARUDO